MEKPKYRSALIVGTGPGLSASLARLLAKNGLTVALAARQTDKLAALAKETGAEVHACNAADQKEVADLFDALDAKGRTPDVVVYNASAHLRGALVDLPPDDVKRAIEISAFGGFLVSQQAARRMLPKSHGAIFLTGATAGVKGDITQKVKTVLIPLPAFALPVVLVCARWRTWKNSWAKT